MPAVAVDSLRVAIQHSEVKLELSFQLLPKATPAMRHSPPDEPASHPRGRPGKAAVRDECTIY